MAASKKDIFQQISILKALNDRQEPNTSDSASSLKGNKNSLGFLTDLIRVLFGGSGLSDTIVDVFSKNNEKLMGEIKNGIQKCIKKIYACQTAPQFPSIFFDAEIGLKIDIDKIDLFKVLKTNPNSKAGKLIYGDDESTDFNLFLYNTIQVDGARDYKGIFTIEYITNDTENGTDVVTPELFKIVFNKEIVTNYNVFLENFVNAKDRLLDIDNLLAKVIDLIFGTIKNLDTFDKDCLREEEIANNLIDKLIDIECEEVFDDDFFTFGNDVIDLFERDIANRKEGVLILENCQPIKTSVNHGQLKLVLQELKNTALVSNRVDVTYGVINVITNNATKGLPNSDKEVGKMSILERILRYLFRVICGAILSPQFMLLFGITNIFFNGKSNIQNVRQFFREHRQLILCIIRDAIVKTIIKFIVKLILTRLKDLVLRDIQNRLLEQFKLKKLSVNSLLDLGKNALKNLKK